ncbi:MAG: NAD-dependent epimerase/dehydratase family protein, partial [Actinobacteria bacterium]|nr:NAD-dependent epimerase/dehydratase family protein [Actinomycetota bacterium]
MEVAVSGSHGLIGTALVRRLETDGHVVRRIVRGADGVIDPAPTRGADAVVNLAGEGIGDHRWSAAHKRRVLDSRVIGTTRLAEALAGFDDPPAVLVSGSAVGFYGDRGDEPLTEESPTGGGFLAEVVRRWEAATSPAGEAG